jgi:transcriptional regulator with XRE-family HTH domain
MKLELNKEWYDSHAANDDNFGVVAGTHSDNLSDGDEAVRQAEEDFAESFAFSTLMRLSRRERGLSVVQLSSKAGVAVPEIISIENDRDYIPKPRTVFQLANFFGISSGSLMKLANLTKVQDDTFRRETIRFAANATDFVNLGEHERELLHQYVHFLSMQDSD